MIEETIYNLILHHHIIISQYHQYQHINIINFTIFNISISSYHIIIPSTSLSSILWGYDEYDDVDDLTISRSTTLLSLTSAYHHNIIPIHLQQLELHYLGINLILLDLIPNRIDFLKDFFFNVMPIFNIRHINVVRDKIAYNLRSSS